MNFVDNNGNFTHTKLEGSEESFIKFRKMIKDSHLTDSQKILAQKCIDAGFVPQGLLLELIIPSTKKKFYDIPSGTEITFDLPPKYKIDK